MSTTTLEPTRTITLTETDLLEAGIVALESQEYDQCRFTLRVHQEVSGKPLHCAEGVFAELLVRAYPRRFAWLNDGQLLDRGEYDDDGVANGAAIGTFGVLQWEALAPHGYTISRVAANQLGYSSIAGANDNGHSFKRIAGALRWARAEVEHRMIAAGGAF